MFFNIIKNSFSREELSLPTTISFGLISLGIKLKPVIRKSYPFIGLIAPTEIT